GPRTSRRRGGRARAMHAQSHLLTPADQPQRLGELDLTRLDELRERCLVLSAASEAGGQAGQGALRDPADGCLVRAQRFRGQQRRVGPLRALLRFSALATVRVGSVSATNVYAGQGPLSVSW